MKISNETKVGVLAAFAIAILILGYNFLKGEDLFKKEKTLFAVYERVDGLNRSDPVQINGLGVGRVQGLTLIPNRPGKILVRFTIDPKVNVPLDTEARIASSDLLGAKVISLILGKSDTIALDGDTLIASIEGDLKQQVTKQIEPVKKKADELMQSIDSVVTVVGYFLNEQNRRNFDKSFANLEQAIGSFAVTSNRLDTMVRNQSYRVDRIMANVESITNNLKNNNEKLNEIMANSAKITKDIADSDLKGAIQNAEQALNDFSVVMNRINSGEGSVGLLLQDPKLYRNLTEASADLDALILDMQTYPSRYFRILGGKDKREKEQLKADKKQKKEDKKNKRNNNNNTTNPSDSTNTR